MTRRLAVAVLLSLAAASSARAEQPTTTPAPVDPDSPYDEDAAPATPRPAPPGTAPPTGPAPDSPSTAPDRTEAPAAAPPAPVALRRSPGPFADPIPAGEYPPLDGPGANQHEGFFFRFLLGLASTGAGAGSHTLSGGGVGFALAIGHSVRPGLIVQFEYLGASVGNPRIEGDDFEPDTSLLVYGLGPAVTYYAPYNLYGTVGVNAAWMSRGEKQATGEVDGNSNPIFEDGRSGTNVGLGASATVGKEWWLTPDWGLGVAARAYLATMPADADEEAGWTAYSLGLLFSSTVN